MVMTGKPTTPSQDAPPAVLVDLSHIVEIIQKDSNLHEWQRKAVVTMLLKEYDTFYLWPAEWEA